MSLSQIIRRELGQNNNDFGKVITDLADGFKQCGFFKNANWKSMLLEGFEYKQRGLTMEEIEVYTSAVSDVSQDPGDESLSFVNKPTAQSTPLVVNKQQEDLRGRKRTRDENHDVDDENLLVPLREATPSPPRKVSKQKKTTATTTSAKLLTYSTIVTVVKNATQKVLPDRISNRRSAVLIPPPETTVRPELKTKGPTVQNKSGLNNDKQPNGTVPVASTVMNTNEPTVQNKLDTDKQPNVPLSNITNRRTTRRQTQLLAAYSGRPITERRSTLGAMQRTSIIFTMIDPVPYKLIFQKFNIYVATANESYDYLVAERIHRSAKFLSAVVTGKPIISIDWLKALQKSEAMLDPLSFLLKDNDGEREFKFSLSATMAIATTADRKLFHNYSILITPNTAPGPDALKDVVFSGGGKYLKTTLRPRKGDQVICVSVEKDKKMWERLKKKYPELKDIITVETFSNMIFNYNMTVNNNKIN